MSTSLSNSELTYAVDVGSPVHGVSLCTVRVRTQSWVKVPKCGLSATKKWSWVQDSREVSLEAAIL
jgi:hypothetical protein